MKNLFLERSKEDIIELNNKVFKLDLSFITVFKFIALMNDEVFDYNEKVIIIFNMFVKNKDEYKLSLEEYVLVVREIINKINYNREDINVYETKNSNGDEVLIEEENFIFDWFEDTGKIYSSFLLDYNIDLIKDDVHWYDFNELFNNLSKDTPIMTAIKYRAMDIPSGPDEREMRKHILDMKEFYGLESYKRKVEEEKRNMMASLFKK